MAASSWLPGSVRNGGSARGATQSATRIAAHGRQPFALAVSPVISQGDLPQAKYHLERAVRAGVPRDQPNRESELSARHAILGTLLLRMGDTSAAREHLGKAALSPNAAIRAAAEKLLSTIVTNK